MKKLVLKARSKLAFWLMKLAGLIAPPASTLRVAGVLFTSGAYSTDAPSYGCLMCGAEIGQYCKKGCGNMNRKFGKMGRDYVSAYPSALTQEARKG